MSPIAAGLFMRSHLKKTLIFPHFRASAKTRDQNRKHVTSRDSLAEIGRGISPMQNSVWKLVVLAGVVGLGLLVANQARRGVTPDEGFEEQHVIDDDFSGELGPSEDELDNESAPPGQYA